MNIFSARYCSQDKSTAVVSTDIAGDVGVPLSGPDFSGGWQSVLWAWMTTNRIQPYEEETPEP